MREEPCLHLAERMRAAAHGCGGRRRERACAAVSIWQQQACQGPNGASRGQSPYLLRKGRWQGLATAPGKRICHADG